MPATISSARAILTGEIGVAMIGEVGMALISLLPTTLHTSEPRALTALLLFSCAAISLHVRD